MNDSQKDVDGYFLDSSFFVFKQSACVQRFFCNWFNEVVLFSFRDQLSFAVVWDSFIGNTLYAFVANNWGATEIANSHAVAARPRS